MALRASFAHLPTGGRCTADCPAPPCATSCAASTCRDRPPTRPAQGRTRCRTRRPGRMRHHHSWEEEDVMEQPDWAAPLGQAYESALAFLTGLPTRPVGARTNALALKSDLGGPLPETPEDPRKVIETL